MQEIYNFRILRAYARISKAEVSLDDKSGKRMVVKLWYPKNPKIERGRLPENLDYGIKVFERLKREGHSEIADKDHPIRPPSAGSLYVTKDGKLICHRRDKGAPTHKFFS